MNSLSVPDRFIGSFNIPVAHSQVFYSYAVVPVCLLSTVLLYHIAAPIQLAMVLILGAAIVLAIYLWRRHWLPIEQLCYSPEVGWYHYQGQRQVGLSCQVTALPNLVSVISIKAKWCQFPYFVWHRQLTPSQKRTLSLLQNQL